jgi:hypothetical protein
MPLSAAQTGLNSQIEAAYINARDSGTKKDAKSDLVIDILSQEFGDAVHAYMLQALVTTTDTAFPGQSVVPSAAVTVSPGTGTGTGNLA